MPEYETLRLPVDADLSEASLEDALALLNVDGDTLSDECRLICGQGQSDEVLQMFRNWTRSFPSITFVPEEILDHPDSWALVLREKRVVVPGRPRKEA